MGKKLWVKVSVKVTRYREEIGKEATISESYYVTNGNLSLEILRKVIREHWFIENKLHYVKDAVFKEDFTKKRVNPYPFSFLIDIAMNILRIKKVKNIRRTIVRNSIDFDLFLSTHVQYL